MPQKPRICIIVLNWNGKNDTLECLRSLSKVDYKPFSILVVDNGSADGSVQEIRAAFPDVPIKETGENLGFAGGNNVGIEWALGKPFEWILLLNNDTIVHPHFLQAFLEAAQAKPQAKILGAKIYRYNDPQRIDHLGGRWAPERAEFESLASGQVDDLLSYNEMESVDYVCGAALFMHRSVPETIGLLEKRFFLFWEETDYCFRARRKGFEVWTAPQARIWHKVSASFTGGKPHAHYFWWRSRFLWLERNLSYPERAEIFRSVVRPELFKLLRHYLLKNLQNVFTRLCFKTPTSEQLLKVKRLKAGLVGALHYSLGRFGNCPSWLINK